MTAGRYMRWLYAYPEKDGGYRVVAFTDSTYHFRERLKSSGGSWDGHAWHMPSRESLAGIPVTVMVRVQHDGYCHEPAGETFASEKEADAGMMSSDFCAHCDSECGGFPIRRKEDK